VSFFCVMSTTSVARWESYYAAASGRRRHSTSSAAVEKSRDAKAPEDFSGNRKAARSDKAKVVGSSPASATIRHPKRVAFLCIFRIDYDLSFVCPLCIKKAS